MKKSLVVISSVLVIAGVFTSSSFAHDGEHGNGFGHHGTHHASIWAANLTPPTAAVAHYKVGLPGPSGATGAVGTALYAQNQTKYAVGVRVFKLSASTKYDVAIYKDGAALIPPAIPSITTDANGSGKTSLTGLRTEFGLDKTVSYTVQVKDPTGAVVLSGALTPIGHKSHRGGCGNKHGLNGTESDAKLHH
jgi:hypothetical protein